MANRFFNGISIALHPIFLTTWGMIIIIWLILPGALFSQWMLLLFCAGYTIVLPLIFIAFARMLGYVSDLRMRNRRERIFTLVVAGVCAAAFGHILGSWHAPFIMRTFVMATAIMMIVAALLAIFSRISLHAIGWGGMAALVSYLSLSQPGLSGMLATVVILGGLAGTARIYLNEHKPWQVHVGFAVGFFTIWIAFIIIPLFGLHL